MCCLMPLTYQLNRLCMHKVQSKESATITYQIYATMLSTVQHAKEASRVTCPILQWLTEQAGFIPYKFRPFWIHSVQKPPELVRDLSVQPQRTLHPQLQQLNHEVSSRGPYYEQAPAAWMLHNVPPPYTCTLLPPLCRPSPPSPPFARATAT